ncbi:MAG: peptidase dimerization domain-containing protein [Acidimicrobiales bacterium]|nr:peptidase dimerization domain-containing protein [Acidimicrobiales bacterium]
MERLEADAVDLLAALVGIDSVNPGLVAGAAGEAGIAAALGPRRERAAGGDVLVSTVRGGTSTFVVADRAECTVEMRTAPGVSGSAVLAEVEALLRPEWDATAELVGARDGWRLQDQGPAADLAGRLGAALGTGATFDAPYWMEAPLWEAVCPTLICGPHGGGMHAVDEWVDLRQVRAFTTALVAVLARGVRGGH